MVTIIVFMLPVILITGIIESFSALPGYIQERRRDKIFCTGRRYV